MFRNLLSKEIILLACSQLCFGALGALIVQLVITHQSTPIIATVNITGLEDSFIRETAKQPLSQTEMKQKVALFADRLNKTVFQLAKQKHLILVPSEAVIAGSPDLTQEVANQVKGEITR